MKTLHIAVLTALTAAGITSASAEPDIKKAYFAATNSPLTKATLPIVVAALNGDEAAIDRSEKASPAPAAGKPAKVKAEKPPKAPAEPKVAKPAEAPDAALARLKNSPDTKIAGRWARVVSVDEMGKRGPTVVTINCDDKGPNGETLTRQIKVQDLFQVKFSKGYAKKAARKSAKAETPVVAAPAAEPIQ